MGFFSKSARLQNLENRVGTVIEIQLFFENRHKRVGGDHNPDLSFDGVERGAEKSFDSKMLLDPFEDQFGLPTRMLQRGDGAMQGSGLLGLLLKSIFALSVRDQPAPAGGLVIGDATHADSVSSGGAKWTGTESTQGVAPAGLGH